MVFEFMSVGDASVVAHLVHIGGALSGFLFVLWDRKKNVNFDRVFNSFKEKIKEQQEKTPFRKPSNVNGNNVQEAEFYDINDHHRNKDEVAPEEIDRILDKISQSGYQNLTEKEKRIYLKRVNENEVFTPS